MTRLFLSFVLCFGFLSAFETTNIQVLHSSSFKGDSFIYDTLDGKKTTLTFEHYRTYSVGDVYMFVDYMDGKKFDGSTTEVYSEIAPRFSLSKIFNSSWSFIFVDDIFIATQLNAGYDYHAYLGGLGVDFDIPGFNFLGVNIYYKKDSFDEKMVQITSAYKTKPLYSFHIEGFIDITDMDINTHNQILYNLSSFFKTKEQFYVGGEWIYYDYSYKGISSDTSVFQAMFKYQF